MKRISAYLFYLCSKSTYACLLLTSEGSFTVPTGCPILGGMLSLNKQIRRQASETAQRNKKRAYGPMTYLQMFTRFWVTLTSSSSLCLPSAQPHQL